MPHACRVKRRNGCEVFAEKGAPGYERGEGEEDEAREEEFGVVGD